MTALNKMWNLISRPALQISKNKLKILFRSYAKEVDDHQSEGPLAGIRILDLTRVLAGPYCTMILGDLGAEVIKIELPGKGDDTRSFGPPFLQDESCYFLGINRNKKSVTINLKKKEGVEIIKKLATKSDILIENYVPGKLDKLGLGYQDLKKLSPKLIYCSITGFGSNGPYKFRPGYDVIAAALGGLLHITGPTEGEPCKVGVAITDITTGLYAHGAILAALLRRHQTGVGQLIECNLLSTQMATLINIASNYLNCGMEATRWGTESESIVPYQAFKTSNGFIVVAAANDSQFQDMCQRMDMSELAKDPRFENNLTRVKNRKILIQFLKEKFLEKSNDEWLKIYAGSKCPVGPINNISQAFHDPQVLYNNAVVELPHSKIGNVKVIGPAVKFEDGGNFCRSSPPTLGQHTEQVMREILQMNEKDIEGLKTLKVF